MSIQTSQVADSNQTKLRLVRTFETSSRRLNEGGVEGSLALATPPLTTPSTVLESDELDALDFAKSVLLSESDAILAQRERLDARFCEALALVASCVGSVVVTGMGKAGLIGRKISATLSSTGTPSHFLHPGEAYHGDLGTIRTNDVVLALSYSGETEEIKRLLAPLTSRGVPIIAIVSSANSALGRAATVALEIGRIEEADFLRLAPSSSAAAIAVCDAMGISDEKMISSLRTVRVRGRAELVQVSERKSVLIGPGFRFVGTSMQAHEFGGGYKKERYPKRPLMGPSLRESAPHLAKMWENAVK